mmetsp:Transcript_21357/g.39087  ORF Transcript_21357/g.39087 Transcript_21357/m.39087 type:complete len:853 (-) Transcript_21357:263-2821(-)
MLHRQYERIKVLGRGSYGQAVLVKDHGRELRVIKEIDLSRLPATARDQAKTEAEVLRKLKHPNIIGYFDTYLDDQNKLCIVMEFADGGDLAALIKQRSTDKAMVSHQEAMDIFTQCCFALQMIHSQHILHRDLKSQNIFLTSTKVVKLGDFGIAKVLDHTAAQANTLIGTPVYLAPEVCDSRPYGIRADIWSLGVVLYELCALKPPFQAENLAALLMKIVKKDPEPLPAACHPAVKQLVDWMLSKEPGDRPSVEDILAQAVVREAAARLPGGGAAPPQPERGRQQADESACRPESAQRADSLDALMAGQAGRRPSGDRARPVGSAPRSTPPVAPVAVDSVSEFQRNREIAKQAKARAEGEIFGRPPSMPSRSSSHEPSGYGDEAGGRYGAAQRREAEREARRMKEQEHIQALQEAAAQAKRDRKQVQQKMQELERPGGQDAARALEAGDAIERAVNDVQRKEMEEARRLQELSEAAQQARRDRKQIQQRMQELENRERQLDGEPRAVAAEAPAINDLTRPVPQHNPAMPKPVGEDTRVKALNEASAEAYRERKRLEELARSVEDEDDAGLVRLQSKNAEADRIPAAPASWSPFADCEVKVPGNPRSSSCGRPSSVGDRSPSAERRPSRGRYDRARGSGAGSSALRMLGDLVAGPRSATPQPVATPNQEPLAPVAGTPDPTPRFGEEGLEEYAKPPLRGALTGPAESASPGKPMREKDDFDLAASSPSRLSSQRRQWSPPPSRWEFRESNSATQSLVPGALPRVEDDRHMQVQRATPDHTVLRPSELDMYEELSRPTSRGASKGPGLPLPSGGDARLAVPIHGGENSTLGSLSYTASTNTLSGATQPAYVPTH